MPHFFAPIRSLFQDKLIKIMKKKKHYPKENLERALNHVYDNKSSVRAASRFFGAPVYTLRYIYIGLDDPLNDSCSPETVFK